MLVLEDLVKKMQTHFPKWMNIRRKINTSTGGKYLVSIAEEIADIQSAIDDYRKDFFLDKYIGEEDKILTYLYRIQIGETNINNVIVDGYTLTDIQKDFYLQDKLAFYENGFIYVKEEVEEIKYSIDGFYSIATTEKIHVWNIFDEFAAFIGIRRYNLESNKDLLNRVLSFSSNKANSAESGIKNAIINSLKNIDKEINEEEITIELPTPENLNKYYDEFETVLDHLANINRDVYRTKRWDIDPWNFKIKSVDYIPHAWDVVLDYYDNGIGFDDDLKVEIVDAKMITDADIYFYQKSLEIINSYIVKNNLKENITLDLIKHSDDLNPINVKYRIEATEIEELDTDNIIINSLDYKSGELIRPINTVFDAAIDESDGINIIDNSVLNVNANYKLRFKSDNPMSEMTIENFKIYNTKSKTYRSLAVNKPGFETTVSDGVRCTLTKKFLSEKYHFSSIENVSKEIEGFVISDVEKPAKLKVNIDDCGNELINYEYHAEEIPVSFQHIKLNNCYISNNAILSDTIENAEKSIELEINANSFSCNIHGAHKITTSINGVAHTIEKTADELHKFKTDRFDMPQKMMVKIILLPAENSQCAISDIMYSEYEVKIYTDHGDLLTIGGEKRLPNNKENNLYIDLNTSTGFSPVLKYIYIGAKLENIIYGDIEFEAEDEFDKLIFEKSNCTAELERYIDGKLDIAIEDYLPGITVVGASDNSYIELNLTGFKEIRSIKADRCTVEQISYGSKVINVVKIPLGVHLREINILGEYEKLISKEPLSNVLKNKGYLLNHYNFYATKNNDNIFARLHEDIDYDNLTFLKIKRTDLISYNTAKVKIELNNLKFQAAFIEDNINKISHINNEHDGAYDYISFYPVATKIYKAINEYNIISPRTIVPSIVNTFDNDFKVWNEMPMYYKVESLNKDFNICFLNSANKEQDYSVESSKILITKKDESDLDFQFEKLSLSYKAMIGNHIDINSFYNINSEKIEIAKYLITNKDLDITYLDKYKDPVMEKNYVHEESFIVNKSGMNKLKYCNIREVEQIYVKNEEDKEITYELIAQEGILKFKPEYYDKVIYIKYNISIARYIKLTLEQLYEKVNFNVNAYKLLNKIKVFKINNGEKINLTMYDEFKDTDLVSIKCSNIGFEADEKDGIVTFSKNLKNNTVAVKTGYYYLDGDEYYLYANENKNNIESIDNIFLFNVIKENKKLYFYQTTKNLVTNSSLRCDAMGNVFNLNTTDKNIKGASELNSISTCENFSHWKTVGSSLSIVKGLNGLGIKFITTKNIDGYAYLNISGYIKSNPGKYTISFYVKDEGHAELYLGKERKLFLNDMENNKQSIIEPISKAIKSPIEDDLYFMEFTHDKINEFYLIVKGNAVIDDIIVCEKELFNVDIHTKNIDHLNLTVHENIYANYQTRLYLDDVAGAIYDGTEYSNDKISNSSYIDWGLTRIKKINEFTDCELTNVDLVYHNNNNYLKTTKSLGKIITPAIYVGNAKTIKNLIFKINEVMFSEHKNFKTRILTSPNPTTGFNEVVSHNDNIGAISGDKISSYIKLIVEMPINKVINNIEIFNEYLSDEVNNPPEVPVLNGSYTSKVLDAQYNTRFIVKDLKFDLEDTSLNDVVFFIRASKQNDDNTVWTDWKPIHIIKQNSNYVVDSRLVFDDYRYFQFKISLKGENTSIKLKYLDLEVI